MLELQVEVQLTKLIKWNKAVKAKHDYREQGKSRTGKTFEAMITKDEEINCFGGIQSKKKKEAK